MFYRGRNVIRAVSLQFKTSYKPNIGTCHICIKKFLHKGFNMLEYSIELGTTLHVNVFARGATFTQRLFCYKTVLHKGSNQKINSKKDKKIKDKFIKNN